MSLSAARRSGVLRVDAAGCRADVAVVGGAPCAVRLQPCEVAPLGDLLLHDGALDAAQHVHDWDAARIAGPVGDWLVQRGLASPAAVALALRRQLHARLQVVFGWSSSEYRFEPGGARVGVPWLAEPPSAADVVLRAMRRLVDGLPASYRRVRVEQGTVVLTPWGRRLVGQAALWPEEAMLAELLQGAGGVERVRGAAAAFPRAARLLRVLQLLGALRATRGEYGLLLRKQRQIRDGDDARALLDLARDAGPQEGRRALKQLARRLHPDTFEAGGAAGVPHASHEVMTALVQAERTLRRAS